MVAEPADTAVTIPPVTVALALLLLQVPPAVASVSVIGVALHTEDVLPLMAATEGVTATVRAVVAVDVPQVLTTV